MVKFDFPVVILAGGKSSRMQRDKSQLPFGNFSTLSEYQYKKLKNLFKDVYISSKEDKFDFLEDKTKLLLDTSKEHSPMIALKSILEQLNTPYCFIITVDLPLLKENTIRTMVKQFQDSSLEILIAKDSLGNTHNLCGIFHQTTLATIKSLLKNSTHKINDLIQSSNSLALEFKEDDQFTNLNTPQEYQNILNK
jgi:molybdenum cofactor guanylyltransferase